MPINTTDTITELSAIGTICSYLGVPEPLDINDIPTDPDWTSMQKILGTVVREQLHKGLEENSEFAYKLTQEIDGTVLVPAGAIRWVVQYDYEERYVERDGKIYDRQDHTDILNKDLVVDIVWNLTFDSLPEIIKHYLAVKTAYKVVARLKGSDSVLNTIQQDLDDANYEFLRYQGRNNKMTLLDNSEVNFIASRHMEYNHHLR